MFYPSPAPSSPFLHDAPSMPWACSASASSPGLRAGQDPSRQVTAPTLSLFPQFLHGNPQPVPSEQEAAPAAVLAPASPAPCLAGEVEGVIWLPAVAATSGFSSAVRTAWVSISPSSFTRHVQCVCRLLLLTAAPKARCGRGGTAIPSSQLLEAVRV